MPTNIIMPSLGFDMTEGKVARWLAAEGDRVEKGAAVVEIETEKATVEVETPASGILARIVVAPGRTVPVGTVIGIVTAADEALAAPPEVASVPQPSPPQPAASPAVAPPHAAAPPVAAPEASVKASPIARRMAEEAGIDLASIQGSGPDGRIMERDVQAAVAAKSAGETAGAGAGTPGAASPMSRMRQAIARRMTESKTTAPHFYASVEILMDEAQKLRRQMNGGRLEGAMVSVNDLVVSAAARALRQFPALNASWRGGGVVPNPAVGIGIAVSLEEGLVTPVLHGPDGKTLREIAAESGALIDRARGGKLRPDDLSGGTFTISNMSTLGVDEFIAIINPPEAAILAVGAIVPRPVAAGDAIRIAQVMKVTLSVDHRVTDGAVAARFLQQLRKLLENPADLSAAQGE
jgi:pyruvate dehydrogenase E2 component (dihydrolipoamide acetyltransferase)